MEGETRMKKLLCLMVALLMCLSVSAVAEGVPSKTTDDLTHGEVEGGNIPADSAFFIRPMTEKDSGYPERKAICDIEIAKMAAEKDKADYFADAKNSEGAPVSVKKMLDAETIDVNEFCPLIAGNYEESYGKVTAKMQFATPYEKDEKVVVLIGIVTLEKDGQTVAWTAYEGVGLGAEDSMPGGIRVELNPEIILAVQDGIALIAIASK